LSLFLANAETTSPEGLTSSTFSDSLPLVLTD